MIKKGILTLVLTAITLLTFAQSQHVTSAAIIFKQYNSEKDKSVKTLKIKEAKEFIDKAYNNESTSNEPKMWMYRAKIYKMIALNHDSLDSDAVFKATESHLKCMQPHPKKKNKIMIYKKWPKEEVLEGLVQCGYKLFNRATEEYNAGNYKSSLKHYTAIFDIIPFDEEDQFPTSSISSTIDPGHRLALGLLKEGKTESRSLLKRLHYRIGFFDRQHYISNNGKSVTEQGLALGIGIPFGVTRNQIDIGFQYVERSGFLSFDSEIVNQITIGLTLGDVWLASRKRR